MRPIGKSGKVVEWIDGASIHRSGDAGEDGAASGFAWILYDLNLKILTELVPVLLNAFLTSSRKDIKALKQALGDLFLWGDGFRDGRLEKVVEESEDLEETLVSSLVGLGKLLLSITDSLRATITPPSEEFENLVEELRINLEKARTLGQTSSDNEAISGGETTDDDAHEERNDVRTFVNSLKIYTTCLMDLLPSMEDTLYLASKAKDEDQTSLPLEFHVSGPARTYILNIRDRFPQADSQLVERLGEANWQRHIALRGRPMQADSSDAPVEEPAKSVFLPVSLFQDSGLGSSLPAQTSYAATSASHTSFISSQADEEGGGLRVPPTPKAVSKGIPFSCETCGQTLSQIKNRVDWKRHVFADLKPYICTFSDCKNALSKFPTRKMWEAHEFEQHRFDMVLCCSICPRSTPSRLTTEEEGTAHLQSAHGSELEKKALGDSLPTYLYKQRKPHEAASLSCPLCFCVPELPGKSRRNFVTHVSKHMESIALAALPREYGSDSESGSEIRSETTSSNDHASDDGQGNGLHANMTYLNQLAEFHKQHGNAKLNQFPTVDKRPLDLYKLRETVETLGGFEKVCEKKEWTQVGRILGYEEKIMSSLSTSSLKNSYSRWLLPYEQYLQRAKEGVPLEQNHVETIEMLTGLRYQDGEPPLQFPDELSRFDRTSPTVLSDFEFGSRFSDHSIDSPLSRERLSEVKPTNRYSRRATAYPSSSDAVEEPLLADFAAQASQVHATQSQSQWRALPNSMGSASQAWHQWTTKYMTRNLEPQDCYSAAALMQLDRDLAEASSGGNLHTGDAQTSVGVGQLDHGHMAASGMDGPWPLNIFESGQGNETTIFSLPAATTIQKKRGRPSKADMERKQKEAIDRGDIIPPAPISESQAGPFRKDDSRTETLKTSKEKEKAKEKEAPPANELTKKEQEKADKEAAKAKKKAENFGRDLLPKPANPDIGSSALMIPSSPAATTKRRGRPSKEDVERRQREAIERGDVIPPAPVSQSQTESSRQDERKRRGARERTRVKYDDGFTEEQWLNTIDDDEDSPE